MSDPYQPQRQSVPPYAPDRPDLESLRTYRIVKGWLRATERRPVE